MDDNWTNANNVGAVYLAQAIEADGEDQELVEDAITLFELSLEKQENAEAYANLASAYALQGKLKKAHENAAQAVSTSPSNETLKGANGVKGYLEIKLADYDAAVESLVNADVENIDNVFNRGLAHLLRDDYDNAADAFEDVTERDADYAIAYYTTAIALVSQGNNEEAIEKLGTAVETEPELKERAVSDLEFAKISDSEEFRNALK